MCVLGAKGGYRAVQLAQKSLQRMQLLLSIYVLH